MGLDLWKGGTIHWRHLAEDAIRASELDYCIVRAAFLLNRPGGQQAVAVRQAEAPLTFPEVIARADVAEALVIVSNENIRTVVSLSVVWRVTHRDGRTTESWGHTSFPEAICGDVVLSHHPAGLETRQPGAADAGADRV